MLQIDNIFTNVSKGLVANKQELENAFVGMSRDKIIKMILSTGELQLADLERGTTSESLIKDIANIVTEKTLNTKTFTRFPVSVSTISYNHTKVIMKAMDVVHYVIKPTESAKKQALIVMKLLESVLPIRRIRMRLSLTFPTIKKESYFTPNIPTN